MAKLNGTKLGAFRAYFFGFFICLAGFLFGYDTGIVGKLRQLYCWLLDEAKSDADMVCFRGYPHVPLLHEGLWIQR